MIDLEAYQAISYAAFVNLVNAGEAELDIDGFVTDLDSRGYTIVKKVES